MFEQLAQFFSPYFTWDGIEVLIKLLSATIFGAIIGWERRIREAGPRTFILICVGATLFTVISVKVAGDSNDPGRVVAQIVTGIGFIGAGVIWREQKGVHGLTTAATIWATAALGILVGLGMWEIAFYTTLVIFGVLIVKKWIQWF